MPLITIVDNAQHYYKLYTKLKNRAISGRYQLNQSGQRIDYLQSILYSLSLAKDKRAVQEIQTECEAAGLLKKSKKPIPYKSDKNALLRFNVDGGEIIVGRNNRENEYITHRYGKPILTATELAVADPDNAGPRAVRATGRLCYASGNRAVTALGHLWQYAQFRERRGLGSEGAR